MSKRALKKYLQELDKEALAEQLLELYEKFGDVKAYYNFVFNPKEDVLINDAKARIAKEYASRGKRRPKARRSVAQKYFRQFEVLGVHPALVADLMAFNLDLMLGYERRYNCSEVFYKSILKAFKDLIGVVRYNGLNSEFSDHIYAIHHLILSSDWPNAADFEDLLE
ncbi:DUF6155 family protein [Robiginitalea sp.]|nr:DUF6155 family protein [Robiginitalea sp.]